MNQTPRRQPKIIFIITLVALNAALLIPVLRLPTGILLALVLPGWGWAGLLQPETKSLPRLILTLGFSYALTSLSILFLHYLPGPLETWQLALTLNILAVAPLWWVRPSVQNKDLPSLNPSLKGRETFTSPPDRGGLRGGKTLLILSAILLLATLIRLTNLNYSEFQGDEALAMISAAEVLEGHADALFLRGKGPGEVLLPTALWAFSGPITEATARIPFVLAGLTAIVSLFVLARALFSDETALFATILFASAGFTVGFSRIVQYQMLVLWMSTLALYCAWQWLKTDKDRWGLAGGLFLGIGLLAHYDAILVIPAIGWLWLERTKKDWVGFATLTRRFSFIILFLLGLLFATLPFYLPYLLDPQASRTGGYLGERIGGGLLKNNLFDFLHFNSFYSSFYYVLITGLLLLGFVGWALYKAKWGGLWATILGLGTLTLLGLQPNLLGNFTGVVFGLVLLAVFFSTALNLPLRIALVWFAVPFLGYNFVVATPLTHIYTVLPGLALLSGFAVTQVRLPQSVKWATAIGFMALSTLYLWQAFGQHSPEFLPNYPESKSAIFITPFAGTPRTGFFGFPHRTGWKSAGALLANGALQGDYDSNEEEAMSSWYTRHAPRACDPGAELVFIASSLVDPVPLTADITPAQYSLIGKATLPNNNFLEINQLNPPGPNFGSLNEPELSAQFDASAWPTAFARKASWQSPTDTNFGGQIRLRGYSLNTGRAYPGGRILLTLYWEAMGGISENYKVFVHLDSDKKYAQADSIPVCARYPTTDWRPGQIIADQHALQISADTPSGVHPLVVGLYQEQNGQRLDVLDIAGNPAGVSLTLTKVEVEVGD